MYPNFHEDRSSGLACASDTYTHTHIQTNIQAKIGIKPTFFKVFLRFMGVWRFVGYGGLWVAVIENIYIYGISLIW